MGRRGRRFMARCPPTKSAAVSRNELMCLEQGGTASCDSCLIHQPALVVSQAAGEEMAASLGTAIQLSRVRKDRIGPDSFLFRSWGAWKQLDYAACIRHAYQQIAGNEPSVRLTVCHKGSGDVKLASGGLIIKCFTSHAPQRDTNRMDGIRATCAQVDDLFPQWTTPFFDPRDDLLPGALSGS
ncbi:hypothetical protein BDZ45DRAFT_752974 [Acephala macrosclerotiorum]|nr:hypothetical protein BDZ45DRAFT_752974 [Acephala macrosclerotiorum]